MIIVYVSLYTIYGIRYTTCSYIVYTTLFEGHRAFLECHIDAFVMGSLGTWDALNEAPLRRLGLKTLEHRWLAYKCAKTCVEHTFARQVNSLNAESEKKWADSKRSHMFHRLKFLPSLW